MSNTTKVWTYTLTNGTLSIDDTYGLTSISFVLSSGSATITGGLSVGGQASTDLALSTSIPVGITASAGTVLTGITITASSGVVEMIGRQ